MDTATVSELELAYRALLDHTGGIAMLLLTPDGAVIDRNRGACEMLGASPVYGGAAAGEIEQELAAAREHGMHAWERWQRGADGRRFWASVTITAVRDASGALAFYLAVIRDLSEREHTLDELRERTLENAAIAAFAHKAVIERRPAELHRAALTYLAAALQSDSVELLQASNGHGLALIARVGADALSGPVIRGGLYAEALQRRAPVARPLTEEDFQAAPHLRGRAVYGMATAVETGDVVTVFAAFSPASGFDGRRRYPLQAIAAMHAAAMVRCAAEEQLADRENRLRLTLEQLPAIVSTFNHDLVCTTAQGSGLAALGGQATLVGRTLIDCGMAEGSPPVIAVRDALRGLASRWEYTYRGRTYENRSEPLRDPEGEIAGCLNLGIDVTDYRETESALRASREQLRRLTAEMNHLQENERRRIARELHDEMGQRLTALRLDLGLLRGELRQQRVPEAEQRIATMFAVIDETIATVRRLATELRPAILDDFGFRAAIEQELAAFSKRTGIATSMHFDPEELTVDHDRGTALYRIIQEALTNVARHSGAARVDCTVELRDRCIHAVVRDNGRGITEEEALTRLGLVGMRERALTLGGVAVIENIPGGGTRVAVAIPDEDPHRG